MRTLINYIFLLLLSNLTFGQNNIDLAELPPVEDLIVEISNTSADTIIIGLHGGPTDQLYPGDFEFFSNIFSFGVVELKQLQHQKPALMANSLLTLEEAIIINDTTTAMLQKVVKHFTNQNKEVVLIGHSFGAFLLAEYIDDYGVQDVHRVIPMSGRLNMNQDIVDGFAGGFGGEYEEDGITTTIPTTLGNPASWAGMKLAAGVGYNRYVDSLTALDLTKLMYVYGTNDQAVGSLIEEEIQLLESTGATELRIEGGNHDSPFDNVNLNQVLTFIRGSNAVGIFRPSFRMANVKFFPTLVEDLLSIEATKKGSLEILNSNGQIVMEMDCNESDQIDLANLTSGFYIARYKTHDNEFKIQKIIVK